MTNIGFKSPGERIPICPLKNHPITKLNPGTKQFMRRIIYIMYNVYFVIYMYICTFNLN